MKNEKEIECLTSQNGIQKETGEISMKESSERS